MTVVKNDEKTTVVGHIRTLTGRNVNGKRTVEGLYEDAIRSADGKIFTSF